MHCAQKFEQWRAHVRPSIFIGAAVIFALFLMNLTSIVFVSVDSGEHEIKLVEFISILLTVVTIVLAALGIGIAILAIWGYQTISQNTKEAADKKASEVASAKIDSHLASQAFEAQLRLMIESLKVEQSVSAIDGGGEASGKGRANGNGNGDIPAYPGA